MTRFHGNMGRLYFQSDTGTTYTKPSTMDDLIQLDATNAEDGKFRSVKEYMSSAGVDAIQINAFLSNVDVLFPDRIEDLQIVTRRTDPATPSERLEAMLIAKRDANAEERKILLSGHPISHTCSSKETYSVKLRLALEQLMFVAECKMDDQCFKDDVIRRV
ncbi:hypothetical protein K402DRAFT_460689 [Aulographum hederae CBS 113979]|uniref:Uncharacterized protein n=1 Tax=Aulographum hederae CBS 113979 TaxID=1176131 RepID=A0A6G1HAA6_9PEZI|nr:hypothetical protein K402DRAFT_460689 [Aulographum hederae CBS 113979]